MVEYAAWSENTERYLRDPYDDTYIRPLFSVLEDDPEGDHSSCQICNNQNWTITKWVPDNGGAWVYARAWDNCKGDVDRYVKFVESFDNW